MLQDIINDRHEQAAVTMHEYFVAKTREVTGLVEAELSEDEVEDILESAEDEELDEALRAGFAGARNSSGEREIALPVGTAERQKLAKQIKDNRSDNRDPNSRGAANDAQKMEREPGESAGDFMKRKAALLAKRHGAASGMQRDSGGIRADLRQHP